MPGAHRRPGAWRPSFRSADPFPLPLRTAALHTSRPRRRRALLRLHAGRRPLGLAPSAERVRLLPRRARPAGLGHPALHRRHRDLGAHGHLGPRHRRPRRPDLPPAHLRLPDRPDRRGRAGSCPATSAASRRRPTPGSSRASASARGGSPRSSSSSPASSATRSGSSPAPSRWPWSPAGACRRRSS